MGFDPRPSTPATCWVRDDIQTNTNSTYSYPSATSRLHSRPLRRSHTVVQPEGAHLTKHDLKPPSIGGVRSHHGIRQSRHRHTSTDQPQNHATGQDWNGQISAPSRNRQKRQAPDRERPAPVNNVAPASSRASAKHAVMMTFIPEQSAERAIAFEPSLFQRDDPSPMPPPSYQRMPLSELNTSLGTSPNRYLCMPTTSAPKPAPHQEKPRMKSAPRSSGQPCVRPPPSSPLSARKHSSEESARTVRPYPREKEGVIFHEASVRSGRSTGR